MVFQAGTAPVAQSSVFQKSWQPKNSAHFPSFHRDLKTINTAISWPTVLCCKTLTPGMWQQLGGGACSSIPNSFQDGRFERGSSKECSPPPLPCALLQESGFRVLSSWLTATKNKTKQKNKQKSFLTEKKISFLTSN